MTRNNYKSLDEAYIKTLKDLLIDPQYVCSPRGLEIYEILNYSLTVENPIIKPIETDDLERNKIIKSYSEKELEWYKSGSIRATDAIQISKFWGNLINPDGLSINSNYGYLQLFDISEGDRKYGEFTTPYEWARNSLLKDKDTRQAIMRTNKSQHCFEGNKDFVCMMYANFHIRENKLNMSVKFRSSDVFTGLVYDLYWLVYIQDKMLQELKTKKYSDLEMGTLYFSADSLHLYTKNIEAIKKMIGSNV